jgi:hypothetical protein
LAGFGKIDLHSYFPIDRLSSLLHIEAHGVVLHTTPSPSEVVFSYFHPLSKPLISMRQDKEWALAPIKVAGPEVLRFGMYEGHAIVDADRAVFDPQKKSGASFIENGSRAAQLAVVLNEQELRAHSPSSTLSGCADKIMIESKSDVVVVKRGIRGALVFQRNGKPAFIDAYRSPRVFKIGTGDIFSAAFAHGWASLRLDAVEAATNASEMVAYYAGGGVLPLPAKKATELTPVPPGVPSKVIVLSETDTLPKRWYLEEAVARLEELGVSAHGVTLNGEVSVVALANVRSVLVLWTASKALPSVISAIAKMNGPNVVVLAEAGIEQCDNDFAVATDFTSALYHAAWNSLDDNLIL